MSNLRILIIAVILFSMWGTGFISGESLKRNIKLHIEVDSKGNAKMNRKLEVGASVLCDLYCKHAEDVENPEKKEVKKQFINESAKGHWLIFGEKPNLKIKKQHIKKKEKNIYSSLTREVEGEFPLMARSSQKGQKGVKEIRIRKFKNKKSVEQYLEYVLNNRLFESVFLRSVKGEQTLVSREETVWQLPAAARIINEKELEGQNWRVDFGGKSIMEANLEVDDEKKMITLTEQIVVSENAPVNLLGKDNAVLIGNLREYGSFVIQYETGDTSSQREPVPDPAPAVEALNLSGSWSWGLDVKETFFHDFTYNPNQQVTIKVTPSITLSFKLGAAIKWAWQWYWSGWRLRCTLDYFETTLTLVPAVGANISISGNAAIDVDWDKTVVKKSKPFTFWVGFVPVVIVLEADLSLNASCDLEGAIEIGTGGGVTLDTRISCRYQNGWNADSFFELKRHFDGFNANAGIEATARAEAPFTVSAYLYYVAGPFAQLNPYIEVSSKAEATTTGLTGIHYNLHGGFEVNGGAKVAGWLKDLLGDIGEYSHEFYKKDVTIYEGSSPVPPYPSDPVRIKSQWKDDTYINIETGKIQATEVQPQWLSAQWIFEPVTGKDYTFRIKNAWKSSYLHIENGKLECGNIDSTWLSAQWQIQNLGGNLRIRSVWKDDIYINNEHAPEVEATQISDVWESAKWIVQKVE